MNGRQPAAQLVRQLSARLNTPSVQRYLRDSIPATLKAELTPARMAKMVIGLFSRTPALHECTEDSIIRAVVECANLGLEPTGGAYTQVYLVPFKREAQVIVSRYGLIAMAKRAGGFERIDTGIIYRGDVYRHRLGDGGEFYHEPNLERADDAPVIAAYVVAHFKGGETSVCVMPKRDIDKRMKESKTGTRGPWGDWYEEMAIKTVIKYAAKNWPMSVDHADRMGRVSELDEGVHITGTIDAVLDDDQPADRSDELADKIKALADKTAPELPHEDYDGVTGEGDNEGYGEPDKEFSK